MYTSKFFTAFLLILAIATCLAVIICLAPKYYLNDILKEKIENAGASDNLKIDTVITNLWKRSVQVVGLKIAPNDTVGQLKSLSGNDIQITGINLWELIKNKNLHADYLRIYNCHIHLRQDKVTKKKQVPEIKIKSVYLSSCTVHYNNKEQSDFTATLDFNAQDFNSLFTKWPFGEISKVRISEINYLTSNQLYRLHVPELTIQPKEKILIADSIRLEPQFDNNEFFKKSGTQTDRINFSCGISLHGFDLQQFAASDTLRIAVLDIDRLQLEALRNKNFPRDGVAKKSLQALLGESGLPLTIGKVNLNKALITYYEIPDNKTEAAQLQFLNTDAEIKGLATIYPDLSITVSAAATALGTRLYATYDFPMHTKQMAFRCSGKTGKIDTKKLNLLLDKLTNVKVKDGSVDSIQFELNANNEMATGIMNFSYSDLQLGLENDDGKSTVQLKIAGALAHLFILKESNPSRNGHYRTTAINYEREPDRFIFNYTWKAMLDGIIPALGINSAVSQREKK